MTFGHIKLTTVHQLRKLDVDTMLWIMIVVQFQRGDHILHVKSSHEEDNFRDIKFLKNFIMEIPGLLRNELRGVLANKKAYC